MPPEKSVPAPDALLYTIEDAEEFAKADTCIYCGGFHQIACPRLKRIRYRDNTDKEDGLIPIEVEYWPWQEAFGTGKWPKGWIVFPNELPDIKELGLDDEKPPAIEGQVFKKGEKPT